MPKALRASFDDLYLKLGAEVVGQLLKDCYPYQKNMDGDYANYRVLANLAAKGINTVEDCIEKNPELLNYWTEGKIQSSLGVVKRNAAYLYRKRNPNKYEQMSDELEGLKAVDFGSMPESELKIELSQLEKLRTEVNVKLTRLESVFGISLRPRGRGKRLNFDFPNDIVQFIT